MDKTFGELYESLCTEINVVPLGLYRNRNNKPYVYIKPHSDVRLLNKDRVYIFAYK